jgi:hypothetical protein
VPTAVWVEPTIAAAHKTLSISELAEKRRPWSSDCTPRAVVHRASKQPGLSSEPQAACAESGPSRARGYWARESRGQYGRWKLSSAPQKAGGKQEASESMACCGIDPHSSVGGVVECRCLFPPSCLPIARKFDGVLKRSSIAACLPQSHFCSVIRPALLDAHDL